MKLVSETQMESVSETKGDPTNPTVDTHDIFSLSHTWAPLKDSAYLSTATRVVLQSNKKSKNQKLNVIQSDIHNSEWSDLIVSAGHARVSSLCLTYQDLSKRIYICIQKTFADILLPSVYFNTKIMTALSLFWTTFSLPKEYYNTYVYPSSEINH